MPASGNLRVNKPLNHDDVMNDCGIIYHETSLSAVKLALCVHCCGLSLSYGVIAIQYTS